MDNKHVISTKDYINRNATKINEIKLILIGNEAAP